MCAISGSAIGAMASLAGTVVSAAGSLAAASAQKNAAEYNQKQAIILAEDAKKRGVQAEEAQRRKTAALIGRQRAVQAGSNLDITSGSALNILADTAQLGEMDAQIIRGNAAREAQGHYASADLSAMEAKSASTAGAFSAFGTVLGGVSSVASKWYDAKPKANSHDPWAGMRTV